MPSQFFGLTIATSGLYTYQAALNTTGHNISNVETKGYSRQVVAQQAADALRTYNRAGMQGSGVAVTGIDQVRNQYYDYRYWNNNTRLGQASIEYYYMNQIENYFKTSIDAESDTTLTSEDFSAIFGNMFNALDEVRNSADDMSKRKQFINMAKNFTDYFNTASTNLKKLQEDTNIELKNKVDEINTIAQQIGVLNKQINIIETNGSAANDLRDQRALLIDQLSCITPVEITEVLIPNTINPDQPLGGTEYTVKIAGQVLVRGNDINTLQVVSRNENEKANQNDIDGLFELKWDNGQTFDLNSGLIGGELKGLIEIRDGNNAENLKGTVKSVDEAARTVTISGASITDVSKMNLPPCGTVTIENREMYYDSFTFDSATGEYTFHITNEALLPNASMLNKELQVGSSVDYMGIPYYMAQLNEFARKFAKTFNDIHEGNDTSVPAEKTGNFFTGIDGVDGTEAIFGDAAVTSTSDSYYQLTAGNFTVLSELLNNPDKMATTSDISGGVSKYDVVDKLMELKDSKDFYKGTSAGQFLDIILTDIAIETQRSKTMTANFDNVGKMINQQRLSVSGVDNDEEGINLIRYQNAYNLSAKMITVLTEIYDRLILHTGV